MRTRSSVRYDVAVAGFTIAGNAGEQGRGELLEHAPAREIECIDVNRSAFERQEHVLADEAAGLRQHFGGAIDVDAAVRQLPHTLAREHESGADATVDIDPRVGARGPGREGECVEFLLALRQILCERLEHGRALVKGETAQVRAADAARVLENPAKVEPAGGRLGDDLARRSRL